MTAHPQIQDHAYVAQIRTDMEARGVLAGNNDVFLVGYGAGVAMALAAAAQRPDLYAGAAVVTPSRIYAVEPPPEVEERRLSPAPFVLYDEPEPRMARSLIAVAEPWAVALGVAEAVTRRQWTDPPPAMAAGVKQLDIPAPASGGPVARVAILNGSIDPFPIAGTHPRDPENKGASKGREPVPGFSRADEVWAFLPGEDPIDATIVDDDVDPP